MMINNINSNAINSYKAINKAKISESVELEKKPGGTFDTVEIDFSQSINSAKANISAQLDSATDAAKINFLKAQYAGGNCPVSAGKIAKSILGD
ncbi:MAG: flagellar biosynthesis anti-sigma factor FlgM [Oscillospiraceae bacterium]|nr:flagellar biosynthesis anti-sigma factor FlgM [Oscillospiraceae bacterium]